MSKPKNQQIIIQKRSKIPENKEKIRKEIEEQIKTYQRRGFAISKIETINYDTSRKSHMTETLKKAEKKRPYLKINLFDN